jgi:hypothetical protein
MHLIFLIFDTNFTKTNWREALVKLFHIRQMNWKLHIYCVLQIGKKVFSTERAEKFIHY